MNKKELLILFAWCIETDDPEQGWPYFQSRWDRPNPILKWNGITNGIPLIMNNINKLQDTYNNFKMTFFIRADEQIKQITGSSTYIFEKYSYIFNKLNKQKIEWAWHPHLYRWDKKLKSWITELHDMNYIKSNLINTYTDIMKLKLPIMATRLDSFFHNIIMQTLEKIGIKIDSSAYPGQKVYAFNTLRNRILRGIKINVCFDWKNAERTLYHPSFSDYQKKGNLNIWELPITSFNTRHPFFFWKNYLTPWKFISDYFYQEKVIENLFQKIIEEKKTHFLITHQHTSDVIRGLSGKIFKNSIFNIKKNFQIIKKYSELYNIPFRFIHLKDILTLLPKKIK